ncbi:MAG: hypothetical protein N2313_04535 [Meiothermus ruber]|uniref:hypothetical protein n=1 Tax=Meiothermus sp. TaxID=1955249 RepID=UPI0025EBF4D9|nr:hypothetical protein [Meiothermus sp.]MCS7069090.1 hypothetical protein [Meiothermus sp.]MCX7802271.1 hypothetical protein [Meiothermus ruber]
MGFYTIQRMRESAPTPSATPLPEDFPARAKLLAAGLHTLEDVRANLETLRNLGLTRKEAEAVRAALGD